VQLDHRLADWKAKRSMQDEIDAVHRRLAHLTADNDRKPADVLDGLELDIPGRKIRDPPMQTVLLVPLTDR
jgi:hypothetical protein